MNVLWRIKLPVFWLNQKVRVIFLEVRLNTDGGLEGKIMGDYKDMKTLQKNETQGVDWDKKFLDKGSTVLVIAPHGGTIEPHTELIAKAIAGEEFNQFTFVGLRRKNDRSWLHVTSSDYEEDDLTSLQKKSQIAISVHGAANREGYDDRVTFLGGGDKAVRDLIWARLDSYGFNAFEAPNGLDGSHKKNFVNRCGVKQDIAGVQLEISRSEREALADNPVRLQRYAKAILEILLGIHESAQKSAAIKSGGNGEPVHIQQIEK